MAITNYGSTSGGGGGAIDVTTLDTSQLVGDKILVYAGPLGIALPTDNMWPRAARAVGLWVGGKIQTTGIHAVKIVGPKPQKGATLYVAGAFDANLASFTPTSSGYVTCVQPRVETPLVVPPTDWARTMVPVGICVDNASYGSGEVDVLLDLRPVSDPTPLNRTWDGAEITSLSTANNFSAVGNLNTQLRWGIGQTLFCMFTVTDTNEYNSAPTLLCNSKAAKNAGWQIGIYGGQMQVRQFAADGINHTYTLFGVVPVFGVNCVWATILPGGGSGNGQIRTILYNGSGMFFQVRDIDAPIVNPDAGCSFRVGGQLPTGEGAGWTAGGIIYSGMLNRSLTDPELVARARAILPTTIEPSSPNRFYVPPDVSADAALLYTIEAKNWGGGVTTLSAVAGAAGTGFPLTTNGTPTIVRKAETMFSRLGSFMLDTGPVFYDSRGGAHAEPVAPVEFVLDDNVTEVGVETRSANPDNNDNDQVPVNQDGAMSTFNPGGNGGVYSTANDVPQWKWISRQGPTLADGKHIQVVTSDKLQYHPATLLKDGSYIQRIVASPDQTFATATTARRMVYVGDDIAIGHDAGGTCTPMIQQLRRRGVYPGRVTAFAATARNLELMSQTFGGNVVPWAYYIAEAAAQGSPSTVDIWFGMGFNDYILATLPVATLKTIYQSLISAVHDVSGIATTVNFYVEKLIQSSYDATANSRGWTVANFNAQVDAIGVALPWLNVKNTRTPNSIAFQATSAAANATPTVQAGQIAWARNIEAALGF